MIKIEPKNREKIQRNMMLRSANLVKVGIKTETEAAQFMVARARARAPIGSGKLYRGIRRRGNKAVSAAVGANGFPYMHWVNQTRGMGMATIHIHRRPNGLFASKHIPVKESMGKKFRVKYGQQPYSYTGKGKREHWNFSGTPRYWDLAVIETTEFFSKSVRNNVKKALRVSMG